MRHTILAFTSALLLSSSVFAQIPEQPLEYTVVSDDPDNAVSKLYVGVEPMFIDFNGTNGFAMGWGLYSHYHIKQKLMFQARMQTPYFRGFIDTGYLKASRFGDQPDEGEKVFFNDYRPAQMFNLDITASSLLMRFEREQRPVKIWLSTGGTDINNYIDGTLAKKRYQVMVRGGLMIRRSTVNFNNLPDDISFSGNAGSPFTNMTAVNLYGGISFNKMWDLVANITELNIGEKISRMHKAYYADVMFSPVMNFKDLEAGGTVLPIKGVADDGYLGTFPLGFRIGVANMPEYKNNLTGWEFGVYPSWTHRSHSTTGGYFKWWWIIDVHSSDD